MFSSSAITFGQSLDLRDCAYGCNANDVNLQPTGAFTLVDINGNPITETVKNCEDGEEYDVRIRLRYTVNSATRYDIRFQATLVNGNSSTFINFWIGDKAAGTYDVIISNTFKWKCGTNLSMLRPSFFWNNNTKGTNLDTSYNCESYNQTKCFRGLEVIELSVPIELPVVWHELSAKTGSDENCVEINWSTLKEWETSHFEIERSIGNIDHFEVIEIIPAVIFSSEISYYQFIDKKIPPNTSRVYYRIKQVDLDGHFDYSKVLMANVNTMQRGSSTWNLYPNPMIGDNLKISLRNPQIQVGYQIQVRVITNQATFSQIIHFCTKPQEIDIGMMTKDAPKGILFIELSWENKIERFKVIKR